MLDRKLTRVNHEAEQYVLGCILREGELIKEINLSPEHFEDSTHKLIFGAMKECEKHDEPVDLGTVALKIVDKLDNPTYLNDLYNAIPSVEPYKVYEKRVMDSWKLRQAEMIANQIKGSNDADVISEAITKLSRLEEIGHEEDFDLTKTLIELAEEFEQDKGELTGIDTGYIDLNLITNGWQDGDLIIVAARPSVGKTAFALNMAEHAGEQGVVTTIFSLEMSAKALLKRMISSIGRIDATKLRNPIRLFKDDDYSRQTMAIGKINMMNLRIYDNPNVTIQDIRAKLRRLKRRYPDQKHICFIDYLTLIKGQGENRTQEVGEITRQLKIIAREFQMPIIVLAQLSRAVEQRQDKRPMMSDLRDSGEIEQHADIIAFLYRDDYYNPETELKNVIEINVAKQRNGPTGVVNLAFIKEYNRFVDLKHGY